MKKVAVLVASLMVAGGLQAATSTSRSDSAPNFSGFAAGVGVGYLKNSVKVNDRDLAIETSLSKSNAVGRLILEYSLPMDDFNLGFGATYDVNDTKVEKNSDGFKTKMKRHTTLYVSPGYVFEDDILAYAKLGYNFVKLEQKNKDINEKTTLNLNGLSVGGGVSYAFLPHMEAGIEAEYAMYKKKDVKNTNQSVKPKATTVMLFYKFRF